MPFSRAQVSTFGTRASTLVAPLRDAARHALAEKPSLPVTESDSAPSAVPDGTASDGKRASTESQDEYAPNDVQFRLYRQRFFGVAGLFVLNVATGMCYPWFGPIADQAAATFRISLSQVNWLSNTMTIAYMPGALLTPTLCMRYGIRRTCFIGAACLVAAAWLRFAGTAASLSDSSSYALLVIAQILGGLAQPAFQVMGPKYSELWFDLKGRTTATMILAIANPIGIGIGQILSPVVGDVRTSILVLAIIGTVAAPSVLLVGSAPPTPPTYAGSLRSQSMGSLLRAWLGFSHPPESHMSPRERIDFTIIFFVFGVLVAAVDTFSQLTNQYFEPVGYSADTAGFLGATLLLAGLVAAACSAPLFDRVLTAHLARTIKLLCPILGAAWLSLIWAVRPNNEAALYAVMGVIGCASLPLLPVSLELAVELTRNAETSSALLFFGGNLLGFIFLLVEDALRDGPGAHPPLSMRRAIVFQGATVLAVCLSVFGIRGRQRRRQLDEARAAGLATPEPESEPGHDGQAVA